MALSWSVALPLTAQSGSTVSLTVSPPSLTIREGDRARVTVYLQGTKRVERPTLTPRDPAIATVEGDEVVGLKPGRTIVMVFAVEAPAAPVPLRVVVQPVAVERLEVTPPSIQLDPGNRLPLRLRAYNGSGRELPLSAAGCRPNGQCITWTVQDSSLALVALTGQGEAPAVLAARPGQTTITARLEAATARIALRVSGPTREAPSEIEIAFERVFLGQGETRIFSAVPRDRSGRALSCDLLTWIADNPLVVRVVQGTDRFGCGVQLTGGLPGVTAIQLKAEQVQRTIAVTVSPPAPPPPPPPPASRTGSLEVVVRASTGAPVNRATLLAVYLASGVTTRLQSGPDGRILLENVVPGAYDLTISAPEYGLVVERNFDLRVGDNQVFEVVLNALGRVSERPAPAAAGAMGWAEELAGLISSGEPESLAEVLVGQESAWRIDFLRGYIRAEERGSVTASVKGVVGDEVTLRISYPGDFGRENREVRFRLAGEQRLTRAVLLQRFRF